MKRRLIKSFGLMLVMLTFSTIAFSQVYTLKSTSSSIQTKINNYKWSEWTECSESSVRITFDLNNDRITINTKVTQVYVIAEYEGKSTDEEGNNIDSYDCVDKNGLACRVLWVKLNSKNGKLFVYYSDKKLFYNIYSLD